MKQDLLRALSLDMHVVPDFRDGRFDLFQQELDAGQKTLRSRLDECATEHVLQSTLEAHPSLLLYALIGGFYAVASPRSALFSKIKLGEKHETDFVFVNSNSLGANWVFVEIERADVPLFTKKGDPSAALTHAMRQVTDWRTWVQNGRAYAEGMLNELLRSTDLHHNHLMRLRDPKYYVVIGRRSGLDSETNGRRASMCEQTPGLEIVTWDRLLDDYGIGFNPELDTFREPHPLAELAD